MRFFLFIQNLDKRNESFAEMTDSFNMKMVNNPKALFIFPI